jgi:hypothetical protein
VVPAAPHSFRYEPELCTLADGQTLSDWRRDAGRESQASGRRSNRRSGRRRSAAVRRLAAAAMLAR